MLSRVLSLPLICSTLVLGACTTSETTPLSDIRITDTEVFPESLDAADNGTVYIGSLKGIIYRSEPGSAFARPWIRHSEENGILTLFGIRVDEGSNTLWACSVPNLFGPERSEGVSSLIAFDLASGDFKARYPFPPPSSVCNDIAIDETGDVYATDTSNGRVFRLPQGEDELQLFGENERLEGVDGIAFSADGTLYVNNVQSNEMYRLSLSEAGRMSSLDVLDVSHELGGPDGLRPLGGNRFVQVEGNIGRLAVVTIRDNSAELDIISEDFESTPGVTVVDDTAYVIESNIQHMEAIKAGERHDPFIVHAVPLPAELLSGRK